MNIVVTHPSFLDILIVSFNHNYFCREMASYNNFVVKWQSLIDEF